jgi:hypothetical protein
VFVSSLLLKKKKEREDSSFTRKLVQPIYAPSGINEAAAAATATTASSSVVLHPLPKQEPEQLSCHRARRSSRRLYLPTARNASTSTVSSILTAHDWNSNSITRSADANQESVLLARSSRGLVGGTTSAAGAVGDSNA